MQDRRITRKLLGMMLLALSLLSGIALKEHWAVTQREHAQAAEERMKLAELAWNMTDADRRNLAETYEFSDSESQERESPIDFSYLLEQNPDTVAWLWIPGTSIDYPVVQGRDNDTYMHRNFYGEEDPRGTIFLDYQSGIPGATKNRTTETTMERATRTIRREPDEKNRGVKCVFYGHYMKDGSMFRDIARFRDRIYLEKHREIWLYTKEQTIRLEVSGCEGAQNDETLRKRCLEEQEKGNYAFVTCSYEGKDTRTILWARNVTR